MIDVKDPDGTWCIGEVVVNDHRMMRFDPEK